MVIRFLAFALALSLSDSFSRPALIKRHTQTLAVPTTAGIRTFHHSSPLFKSQRLARRYLDEEENRSRSMLQRVLDRFDTTESAGLEDAKLSGIGKRIKGLHGPITYLVLGLAAGLKYKWCFRSPYYWFAMAFCVKWYRARYVFKIPVWDRQPNWNNIITSKEQEKDLKAFTCKNCGSTLFIAKTREFFFEGDTGIGGLGCFSCGAKGADNFIQDRERIVEEVSDEDDYFEYERPLDFVSRAERRKLMKEAGGDEEVANQLLVGRSTTDEGVAEVDTTEVTPEDSGEEEESEGEDEGEGAIELDEDSEVAEEEPTEISEEVVAKAPELEDKPKPSQPKPKEKKPVEAPPADDFDILGMDDF